MLALGGLTVGLAVLLARPDAQPVWSGGASRPLIEEWAGFTEAGKDGRRVTPTSRPDRISQVTMDGRRAYKFTVLARDRDRYSGNSQRTELGQGNPRREFGDGTGRRDMGAGDERWVAEAILIPPGAPTGDHDSRFFLVNQFKMDGPGGPAAGLSFEHNRLVASRAPSRAPRAVGAINLGRTPVVPRGRWLEVLWHIRWSHSSDGLIEVFADVDGRGLRRFARYRGWTLKRGGSGKLTRVHPRIGIYRRAMRRDTSIYISGFNVATDRQGAESAAGF